LGSLHAEERLAIPIGWELINKSLCQSNETEYFIPGPFAT